MARRGFRSLTVVLLMVYASALSANIYHDSNLDWKTIETEHFLFHYHDGVEPIVREFIPTANKVHDDVTAYFSWTPQNKTHVVFTDEFDLSNGWATVFPWANTHIFLAAPDDINSLEDHNGWLDTVFLHEYVHIVHLDKARGAPLFLRKIFGREGLVFPTVFPNAFQPSWFIEGIATYIETDHEAGIGRGQSSYYNMLTRMELEAGLKELRRINQPIGSWPGGTTRYLYGVNFHEFLREKYGDKKIRQMVEGLSDNFVPYRIDSNTKRTFAKDLDTLWAEFEDFLKKKHEPTFERVKQEGQVAGKALTNEGYSAESLRVMDDKAYYVAFNGRSTTALMLSEDGKEPKKLRDLNFNARLDLHKDKGILIAQPEICRNARIYYDIYRADLDGGGYERLTDCARYRFAVWNRQGDKIYAVHNQLGVNELHVLDTEGKLIEKIWTARHGEQVSQMSYSPTDDLIVASVWRKDQGWNLEKFDIALRQWTSITRNQSIQAHPTFSDDGRSIIYSSDYDGVYNVYKLSINGKKKQKLTNLKGGAFTPGLSEKGLFYIGSNPQGYDLYHLAEPKALASFAVTNSEISFNNNALQFAETRTQKSDAVSTTTYPSEDYSPWSSLKPSWWLPYVLVDDQRQEYGVQTFGNDALSRHAYSTFLAYDVDNEWFTGSLDYFYDGFWPIIHFGLSRETDIFLDGNDDPIRIRAEKRALLEAIVPFSSVNSTLLVHAALATEREDDAWRENGIPASPDTREDLAGLGLRYISAKYFPLSVSRSEGRDIRLVYEDTDAFGDSTRKGQTTTGEWREFFHIGREHVLALRLVEGRGDANSEPFRLGGIESDSPFAFGAGDIAPIFNDHEYPLRGYDEGHAELRGQNMRLFSLEYRFPLWRIEHGWMVPPFGFNQVHGTVFYDTAGTWADGESSPATYYDSVGAEFNTDMDLGYNFRISVSLGIASGLDDAIGEDKVYLRIGSQF